MSRQHQSFTLPTIAIIGGGFSGTSVAFHLVTQTTYPMHIVLIERSSRLGKGLAYSTQNPFHFLNVPADQMSAWNGHPNDFYDWISRQPEKWHTLHSVFNSLPLTPKTFLPRLLYGKYLQDLLIFMQQEAKHKQIILDYIQDEAQAIERDCQHHLFVHLKHQKQVIAQAVILATGVPNTKQLSINIPDSFHYISDCWNSSHFLLSNNKLNNLSNKTCVFILGTGLTMVDMCMGLWARGFSGQIMALSPQGKLPEVHKNYPLTYPNLNLNMQSFNSIRLILKFLRQKVFEASSKGYDWRTIIDSLRPYTSELWSQLSIHEQQRFFRLVYHLWNKHRHRMAPYCGQVLKEKIEKGHLCLLAGRVKKVVLDTEKHFKLIYCNYLNFKNQKITVDYLLNCLGPNYQISKNTNPLIRQLHAQGVLNYDALDRGIKTEQNCQVKGVWSHQLYAIGSLLLGEKFETTAVPELREQAHHIAKQLIETLRVF